MVDTQLTDIPFGASLYGKLKKASYMRHRNTLILEKRKYNNKLCDDPTIQHFMWGDASENNKVSGSDSLHVRNQVTPNDEKKL